MNVRRLMPLLAIAAMGLLSACAGATSSGPIARPPLVDYPLAFQVRAAEELERLGPGCPLHVQEEEAGCSAIATMIEDYGELRARVRAE